MTQGVAGSTSIAPDHAIKHENRAFKVTGGIIGITLKEKALDKFFLISPEMSKLLDKYVKEYGMGSNDSRTQHHEITGGKLFRITKNATKLHDDLYLEQGNPFTADDDDDKYNLLTREVMNEKVTKNILGRDDIGQQMFEGFVTERLTEGNLSVWDPMKRKKLGIFKSANAAIEVSAGDKLVNIKESSS